MAGYRWSTVLIALDAARHQLAQPAPASHLLNQLLQPNSPVPMQRATSAPNLQMHRTPSLPPLPPGWQPRVCPRSGRCGMTCVSDIEGPRLLVSMLIYVVQDLLFYVAQDVLCEPHKSNNFVGAACDALAAHRGTKWADGKE